MQKFLRQDASTRLAVLEQTAARKHIDLVAVEKDFWVCWTLGQLFSLPGIGDALTFKGGTSLSKVWGLIERFSEDIDLVLDKQWLGITPENDPELAANNSQLKNRLHIAERMSSTKICGPLREALEASIRRALPADLSGWLLEVDPDDEKRQTLLFHFPRMGARTSGYLLEEVKIEIGTRSDPIPSRLCRIRAEVAEAYPQLFDQPWVEVRSVEPVRTFLEKVALLHEAGFKSAVGKPRPARLARHYYDIAKLIHAGIGDIALGRHPLFEKVLANRMVYFKITGLDYRQVLREGVRILPESPYMDAWARDYEKMGKEMFYGAPPSWPEVMRAVGAWELAFNHVCLEAVER